MLSLGMIGVKVILGLVSGLGLGLRLGLGLGCPCVLGSLRPLLQRRLRKGECFPWPPNRVRVRWLLGVGLLGLGLGWELAVQFSSGEAFHGLCKFP